jgi:3-hydroxy-9,10-secoandrosta-1,3,5(10)-triene-9,17-dione monooxygenase reductase component
MTSATSQLDLRVDQERLRAVMARYLTGVSIVTAPGPVGLTASSFTSVAVHPPTVLVCLHADSGVRHAIAEAGCYAINMLGGSQARLARRFAERGLDQAERFRWLELEQGITGSPLIAGAAAWLDCRLREEFTVATHVIAIGEVLAAGADPCGEAPLAYHERALGPLR